MSVDDQPRRIGRYEVVRVLGEGGMGKVFLARDPSLDRMVAIKTVRLTGIPEAARLGIEERFKNEARAVAKLLHPTVVGVHDTGLDDEVGAYAVFEYVPGESLRERLDRPQPEPLSLREVARIIESVAVALQTAHDQGIVHRDVKPANILLATDGSVKLADFGVARLPDVQVTREGMFLGTPSYASPEALARGEFSPLSDVWALGVVAYETVCGRHPFAGDDVETVSNKVLHLEIPPPASIRPEVGRAASDAILSALARDPRRRVASARGLSDALCPALRGVAPDGPTRSRRIVGFAAAAAALLAASLAVRSTMDVEDLDAGPDDAALATHEPPPARPAAPVARPADAAAAPLAAAADAEVAPANPREEEERVKSLLDEGKRLLAAGEREGARAAFRRVLSIDPTHPEARQLLEAEANR